MNYVLNCQRLHNERRPAKLKQHLLFVRSISDLISPDNPLALYSSVEIGNSLENKFDKERFDRLSDKISGSSYWADRFSGLGLNLVDLNKAVGK